MEDFGEEKKKSMEVMSEAQVKTVETNCRATSNPSTALSTCIRVANCSISSLFVLSDLHNYEFFAHLSQQMIIIKKLSLVIQLKMLKSHIDSLHTVI